MALVRAGSRRRLPASLSINGGMGMQRRAILRAGLGLGAVGSWAMDRPAGLGPGGRGIVPPGLRPGQAPPGGAGGPGDRSAGRGLLAAVPDPIDEQLESEILGVPQEIPGGPAGQAGQRQHGHDDGQSQPE
jgi:hypothetical protein